MTCVFCNSSGSEQACLCLLFLVQIQVTTNCIHAGCKSRTIKPIKVTARMVITITVGLQTLHFHCLLDSLVCRWLLFSFCFLFLLSVSKGRHHCNLPLSPATLSYGSDRSILAFQLAKLLQIPFINGQLNNDFSQAVILLVTFLHPCTDSGKQWCILNCTSIDGSTVISLIVFKLLSFEQDKQKKSICSDLSRTAHFEISSQNKGHRCCDQRAAASLIHQ